MLLIDLSDTSSITTLFVPTGSSVFSKEGLTIDLKNEEPLAGVTINSWFGMIDAVFCVMSRSYLSLSS